jgi:hypothetical protein
MQDGGAGGNRTRSPRRRHETGAVDLAEQPLQPCEVLLVMAA